MGEQSNFSQVTAEGVENDADDESGTAPSSSERTPRSKDSSSDITKLADPAVESWVAEREESAEDYGYFHLFVVAKSDLNGVEHRLHYVEEIDLTVSEADTSRQYGGRWGKGGVRVTNARDRLIDWKLDELATPYHPDLRTVSATNLRIFVADSAHDLLGEQDIEIGALVETLNQFDEHEPTAEQLATHREYSEACEAVDGWQAPLSQRVRAIESTVRAQFDFSHHFGGEVPDPHPDYQNLDANELKVELERARSKLEQTEQRKKSLSQKIADEKAQWIENRRSQL
jgi:hypothetical protein